MDRMYVVERREANRVRRRRWRKGEKASSAQRERFLQLQDPRDGIKQEYYLFQLVIFLLTPQTLFEKTLCTKLCFTQRARWLIITTPRISRERINPSVKTV